MEIFDKKASQIICENVQIPADVGTNPVFVKCTLMMLRGMATPGSPISFDREELKLRTQLKKRTLELCLKALIDLGFIEQIEKPAPGRSAAYQLNHDAMIPLVPEAALDRAERQIELIRRKRTGAPDAPVEPQSKRSTGAPAAPERAHPVHLSESTGAPGAQTGAPGAQTGAPGAPDIKEEPALPAQPAAAAQPHQLTAEQLLENAAAAAAVMQLDDWVRIAYLAGIERDHRRPLARIITDRGVQIAEHGRRVLERLAELMDAGQVHKPSGMLIKLLEGAQGDSESPRTERRHRRDEHRRELFMNAMLELSPAQQRDLMGRTRKLLEGQLGIEAADELMPGGRFSKLLRDWPEMLDFMESRCEQLGITKPGQKREGAAA